MLPEKYLILGSGMVAKSCNFSKMIGLGVFNGLAKLTFHGVLIIMSFSVSGKLIAFFAGLPFSRKTMKALSNPSRAMGTEVTSPFQANS